MNAFLIVQQIVAGAVALFFMALTWRESNALDAEIRSLDRSISRLEDRYPRGSRGLVANQVGLKGREGSNPSLSAEGEA